MREIIEWTKGKMRFQHDLQDGDLRGNSSDRRVEFWLSGTDLDDLIEALQDARERMRANTPKRPTFPGYQHFRLP